MARPERVRISVDLHKDPDFTGLTRMAQWLYFTRVIRRQEVEFSVEETMTLASDVSREELEMAVLELGASKYAHVLNRRPMTRRPLPKKLRQEVLAADGWACVLCGSKGPLEVDHIVPVKHGGGDERSNLQTLCKHHNRKKGARLDALVQGR